MTTVAGPVIWISNGGEVTCTDHGGGYLSSAVKASPRKRTHVTPLDYWTRATAQDIAELAADGIGCETCKARTAT